MQFKKSDREPTEKEEINLDEVAEVRGWKALGNKLTPYKVLQIKPLAPRLLDTPEAGVDIPLPSEIEEDEEALPTGEQLGLF